MLHVLRRRRRRRRIASKLARRRRGRVGASNDAWGKGLGDGLLDRVLLLLLARSCRTTDPGEVGLRSRRRRRTWMRRHVLQVRRRRGGIRRPRRIVLVLVLGRKRSGRRGVAALARGHAGHHHSGLGSEAVRRETHLWVSVDDCGPRRRLPGKHGGGGERERSRRKGGEASASGGGGQLLAVGRGREAADSDSDRDETAEMAKSTTRGAKTWLKRGRTAR